MDDTNRTAGVTQALSDWNRGDKHALNRLVALIYPDLRSVAERQLRRERTGHTLQPTALIHEVFLQLLDQRHATAQDRAQFLALAAHLMRRILVDYARARHAAKRGGRTPKLALDSTALEIGHEPPVVEVLAVDRALERLARQDADQARIVELRFFGGLSVEETARVLECSPRTVKREWRLARAWLFRELQG